MRLQADRVSGDPLLLSSESIHVLNSTGEEIAKRCDGRTTVREIIDALAEEYDAEVEEVRADVLECLQELHARRLIVEAP